MSLQENARRPRVGIVMPLGHQQGGAENLLLNWLRQGSEHFELTCAFLQEGPMVDATREMGITTEVIPATRLSDPRNYRTTALRLRVWIRCQGLVAVVSWMPKAHLYVAPAAIGLGVKALWFQHGIPAPTMLARLTSILPADCVMCCSRASQVAQRRLSHPDRTVVCYPGVRFPVRLMSREQARELLGLPANAMIVGMVARWERWKGVHIFLESARCSAAVLPGAIFFVVGGEHPRDPGYAAEIREAVDLARLGDRLRMLGHISPDEVAGWLSAADLIVHPATGSEPFGMVVAEAMAVGRAVVASNIAGPAEIIQDGVNGLLIPPGDAASLSNAIEELLASPEYLQSLGEAAYVRGRSFSVPRLAARLDEIIAETLI